MISIAYVNNDHTQLFLTDPYILCESAIEKIANESNEYIKNFKDKYDQFMVESAIMGEQDSTELLMESSNVFQKIGESIIAIFNKFKDLVVSIGRKITEIGFKGKSDLEKMDKMIKAHPDLRDDIIAKFNSGDLLLSDARSLRDIEATYDELIKAVKDSKIDTRTFKGKVEAFKKKLKEADKSAVVKGAAAIATIAGAGTAILAFRKNLKEVQKEQEEELLRQSKFNDKLLEVFKSLDTEDENGKKRSDDLDTTMGKVGIIKQLTEEMTLASINKTKKNHSFITKFEDSIKAFIKKHDKNADAKDAAKDAEGKKFIDDMRRSVKSKDISKAKDVESQAKGQAKGQGEYADKNADAILRRAAVQAKGQAQGQGEYADSNRKAIRDRAANQSYGQSQGQHNYRRDNETEILSDKRKDSEAATKGKNDATPKGSSEEKKAYDAAVGAHKAQTDINAGRIKTDNKNSNRPKN